MPTFLNEEYRIMLSIKEIYAKHSHIPRIPFVEVLTTYFNSSKTDKNIKDSTASSVTKMLAVRIFEKGIDKKYKSDETPTEVNSLVTKIDRHAKGILSWETKTGRDLLFEICIALQVNHIHETNAADWFEILGLEFTQYSLWDEVVYTWCLVRDYSYSEYLELANTIAKRIPKIANSILDLSKKRGSVTIHDYITGTLKPKNSNITDIIKNRFEYIIENAPNENDFILALEEHERDFHLCSYKKHDLLFGNILGSGNLPGESHFDKWYFDYLTEKRRESARQMVAKGGIIHSDNKDLNQFLLDLNREIASLKTKDDYSPHLLRLIRQKNEYIEDMTEQKLHFIPESYGTFQDKYDYIRKTITTGPFWESFTDSCSKTKAASDINDFDNLTRFETLFEMYTFNRPIDRHTFIMTAVVQGRRKDEIDVLLYDCGFPMLYRGFSFDAKILQFIDPTPLTI